MASFLIGQLPDSSQIWACVDASLCTAPAVADRRYGAYMALVPDEQEAREAMIAAGALPDSITPEQRSGRRRGKR